jgi:hypothetical protein
MISRICSTIPTDGKVIRKLNRARTPESKVRVRSQSLNPIDSIDSIC